MDNKSADNLAINCPDGRSQAPLGGGIRYNGPADTLYSFFGPANQSVSGPIAVAADFSCRLSDPCLQGVIRGKDMTYDNQAYGTRLTNITRHLRHRDPDEALARADAAVADWRGGTRIATSLAEFNRRWARRVLTGNAATLLVTDGLDRDEHGELGEEAARLSRYSRELIWLNPLLRFEGFEPRAAGIRAILPHVDRLVPMHNLDSLGRLAELLGTHATPRSSDRGTGWTRARRR